MSHGSVAAARSSCAKFFPKSEDKIPGLYCTVWIWPPVLMRSRSVGMWWCGWCWLRLRCLLPYRLVPLIPAGAGARLVASFTQVCQKCHRLVQPFLITGSFWQMHVRERRLGRYSSRGEGGGTHRWGQKPAPPVHLGLQERFGRCLCGSKEHVFWRLRVAFVLALRYQCWRGFMIHQWTGMSNFRYAVARVHFMCRVFVEGARLTLEVQLQTCNT